MFTITMPWSFKIGDTADVKIYDEPAKLTWRDNDTLVIGDDARTILQRFEESGTQTFFAPIASKTNAGANCPT
jgi:hypothetical protein